MALRMTEEEYADFLRRRGNGLPQSGQGPDSSLRREPFGDAEKPRRNKYGARKVVVDGLKFDSRHEADYYFGTLLPRYRAGELRILVRQAPFDLPGGVRYVADFLTVDTEGRVDVIDAKSEATRKIPAYRIKKRQMRAVWDVEIREV